MKNAVRLYTYLTLLFIFIYSISGMLSGIGSEVARVLAFALPTGIGLVAARRLHRLREEEAGTAIHDGTYLGFRGGDALSLLPLVMPVIATVFLISYLTSLLLTLVGAENTTVPDAPIIEMLLLHAVLPTILEEMLFRYLPLKLIAPYSGRWCIILSSLYFALIHMNAYQIPYALFAGLVFITLDLMAGSVWPSVILHLLNNTVSVFFIKYGADETFVLWFIISMAALAVLSLIPVAIRRRHYLDGICRAADPGETLTERRSPMLLTVFCLAMAVLKLFN